MTDFKLFFSHRTSDTAQVKELLSNLAILLPNFPIVDVSKDVPSSDDWKSFAKDIIDSCDVFVCIVGQDTYESEPVNWEIIEASRSGKPLVITILSEEYRLPPACAELGIKSLLWDTDIVAGKLAELLVPRALFINHDWRQGAPDSSDIYNQYQIMVNSWEALIQRRQNINIIYLSANTALLAAIGALLSSFEKLGYVWSLSGIIFLGFLGSLLSSNWRQTIISYGLLSKAKAKVVTVMESYLWAKLFDTEWGVLEANKYKSTTSADSNTALLFTIFFIITISVALVCLLVYLV